MIARPAGNLPLLHDPVCNERVQIEALDGWQLLGSSRCSTAYPFLFENNETPLQLLRTVETSGGEFMDVSILTPCSLTAGRFELAISGRTVQRKCCYRCVTQVLNRLGLTTPDHRQWIVYMLLESRAWLSGPAPKERPYV